MKAQPGERQAEVLTAIRRAQRAEKDWTYQTIGEELGMSAQQVGTTVMRLRVKGQLVTGLRRVLKQGLVAVQ